MADNRDTSHPLPKQGMVVCLLLREEEGALKFYAVNGRLLGKH